MKVFTTILFLGAFLVLIGMPEEILAGRLLSTTPRPPPGPNEEYWPCGSRCQNSCARPRAEEGSCGRMCVPGNFCKDGYIRESLNGPCIRPSECPARASRQRQ